RDRGLSQPFRRDRPCEQHQQRPPASEMPHESRPWRLKEMTPVAVRDRLRTHPLPGGAALRRKTLHRVMNELIEAWEEGAGVREFVILTAQANDAHLEALSTIRTGTATVVLLDVFGLDFGSLLSSPEPLAHGGELD